MFSRALMPSTDRVDTSSGGVSRTNYIGQCDPLQLEPDETSGTVCWFRFPVCEHSEGIAAYFDVCLRGDRSGLTLSEVEAYRLLCHAIVQSLPDAAFKEAVESLSGMYEFYQPVPALPATQAMRSVKAKVTGSYAAPVFSVGEE